MAKPKEIKEEVKETKEVKTEEVPVQEVKEEIKEEPQKKPRPIKVKLISNDENVNKGSHYLFHKKHLVIFENGYATLPPDLAKELISEGLCTND